MAVKVCEVCGIGEPQTSIHKTKKFGKPMILCKNHYNQANRLGSFYIDEWRDKNEIIEREDFIEICLYNIIGDKVSQTVVSKHHLQTVEQYKWWNVDRGYTSYAYGTHKKSGETTTLHKLISSILFGECPDGMSVDHKNRDGLDNRDENLRYATQSEQLINQRIRSDNTSGVKGVDKNIHGKWRVRIQYGKIKKEELFETFEEAVEQRLTWEKIRDGDGY